MLGLGSGKAVAWRNGIAIQGHKVWWLKDRIDRRWMRMYTELPVAVDADAPTRADGDDTEGASGGRPKRGPPHRAATISTRG